MKAAFAATLIAATLPTLAAAQDMSSVCYSRGSESDGVTGFIHDIGGRALRIDSPWANDSRTRMVEWQDEGFAEELLSQLILYWGDIPTDLLSQCDEGWRDTVVVRYDDGSTAVREGSCIRNPVAQALDAIFAQTASLVENETETFSEGAAPGVYTPCFQDW